MSLSEFVYTVLLKPKPLRWLANRILCSLIPPEIHVRGATVIPNPHDPVVCGALALGVYEKSEISFFCERLRPGMTFVDVGANVGLYAALAINQGAGKVLAIEPLPETFAFLQKTLAANVTSSPIVAENVAAGREKGTLTLHCNPDNKGDNRLYADPMLAQSYDVAVETLDDLCERHGIPHIDFLKIDVQGAEWLVIDGALRILSQSPGCLLMTEFWPDGIRKSGGDPRAYLDALASVGFELSELVGDKIEPLDAEKLIKTTTGRSYRNIVGVARTTPNPRNESAS